jgi:hypothetical protein
MMPPLRWEIFFQRMRLSMDDSTLALGEMQAPFGRDAYAHACGIR